MHKITYKTQGFAPVFLSLLLLCGCAAGPDFKKPSPPGVASYGSNELPDQTVRAAGGIQRFRSGGDVPAAWWALYQNPQLSHLMDRAIKANPSLDAARAALRAAEETASASYGGFFPAIDGSVQAKRNKNNGTANPYTLYNTSVNLSYAPDIFGGTRRTVEAQESQAEAAKFELEAAYLTLTGNIVTTAIQEASLREQSKATQEVLAAQKKQLELMKAQLDAGAIARPAYLAQATSVAATEASLPSLETQLAQNRHLLSILLGQLPSETPPATFDLASFKLPEELPLSVPSKLVEQRPDIRVAQANLQAANAQIGIAMAAMLPQFPLTASYGVAASRIPDMFSPTTAIWGLAAGLTQPLFHGGELLHKKRAAEASFDQAAAQYRSTVLSGFKDVADVLRALEGDAQTLAAQENAERAAAETLAMTTEQFNAGAVSYVALLSAQSAYQQAKIGLIKAQATRLADTAALFQALGGGWWNRTDDATTQVIKSTKK